MLGIEWKIEKGYTPFSLFLGQKFVNKEQIERTETGSKGAKSFAHCEVRTHASFDNGGIHVTMFLKTIALDHSAKCAFRKQGFSYLIIYLVQNNHHIFSAQMSQQS